MLIKRNVRDGACRDVTVIHTGVSQKQNFATQLVAAALQEGWMELYDGKIIIKTPEEKLYYTILKEPGYYCCYDDKKMADATMAKAHIETNFKGIPSPDPCNPQGYKKIDHYECILDKEQHEKYKLNSTRIRKPKTMFEKLKGFLNG